MKIRIDIDCSPEEARTFLGLPDVTPLQEAILKQMEDQMLKATNMVDPEQMMKYWFPIGQQSLDTFQKFFTAAAQSAATSGSYGFGGSSNGEKSADRGTAKPKPEKSSTD